MSKHARRGGAAAFIAVMALMGRVVDASDLSVAVVDHEGRPVADAVVFVKDMPGRTFKAPAKPYVLDQFDSAFVPQVLPIVVGAGVIFPNKDGVHHQVYSFSPAKAFELPLRKGGHLTPVIFDKLGVVKVGCNIHDWMTAVILVLPNPHFAVTNAQGRAVLAGLPKNKNLELLAFHSRLDGPVDGTSRRIRTAGGDRLSVQAKWTLKLKTKKTQPPAGARS